MTSTVPTVSFPNYEENYRSVPMERLVAQAQEMAEEGVKELILVAQETTVYGTDIYGKKVPAYPAERAYVRSKGSAGSACCTAIRRKFMMN